MDKEALALRHPGVRDIMRYFDYEHLPEHLQNVSHQCYILASNMLDDIPQDSAEFTTGLRKLLEAKDCFVRAALDSRRD